MTRPEIGLQQSLDWLGDLRLRAKPLTSRADYRIDAKPLDLRTVVSVENTTRTLTLPTPFIVRGLLDVDRSQPFVTKVTSAMKHVGGMILADASTFAKLPLNSVPRRICAVRHNSIPLADELQSADAIELQLINDCSSRFLTDKRTVVFPKWPSDVPDLRRLETKIQLLRKLADEPIPVGVAMLASDVQNDVETMVHCGVDFISLLMPIESARLPIPWIIRTARKAAIKAGRPQLSIWVEADVREGWDLAKLVACGASAIILDPMIQPWVNKDYLPEEPTAFGLTKTLATREDVIAKYLTAFREKLVALADQIWQSVQLCGCDRLSELTVKHLVAINYDAHRMCDVPLLGET